MATEHKDERLGRVSSNQHMRKYEFAYINENINETNFISTGKYVLRIVFFGNCCISGINSLNKRNGINVILGAEVVTVCSRSCLGGVYVSLRIHQSTERIGGS